MNTKVCNAMLEENSYCVLSTCKDNRTNSSLMLYLPDPTGTRLYMITSKDSLKYRNIEANPEVSLLIDNREHLHEMTTPVKAMTVFGQASFITDETEKSELLSRLVERHSRLQAISSLEDVCLIQVEIRSFLFLDGINDATFIPVR